MRERHPPLDQIFGLFSGHQITTPYGSVEVPADQSFAGLTVQDGSGTPSFASILTIQFSGATLSQPSAGTVLVTITGGGSIGPGTQNKLAKFTASGVNVQDSNVQDSGATVIIAVDVQLQGRVIESSANALSSGTNDVPFPTGARIIDLQYGAPTTITGLAGGTAGLRVAFYQNSAFSQVTLAHESASSAAGNRFHNKGSANLILASDLVTEYVWYNNRWREVQS